MIPLLRVSQYSVCYASAAADRSTKSLCSTCFSLASLWRGGLLRLREHFVCTANDGRRQHDARGRDAVGQQPLDSALEFCDRSSGDLEDECLAAGDVMAFADLSERLNEFEERLIARSVAGHPDVGEDRQT